MNPLENINIVLVRTFHPGNIGSSARAMKNMGLNELKLVAPKDFPNPTANQMAAGAEDLIESADIADSIESAVGPCTIVAATTARVRGYDLPEIDPEQCAQMVYQNALAGNQSAILFGPERMGLHNDDLKQATHRLTVPANPDYPSLNLAAAVQLVCYEIFKQHSSSLLSQPPVQQNELPTAKDINRFYQHLESSLKNIGFLRPHQGETMDRIRHLFSRAVLQQSELQILRGILSAIDRQTLDKQSGEQN